MTTSQDFLAAVRGIEVRHVAAAMNCQTPGIVWMGCTKAYMAQRFDDTRDERMQRIDLAHLALQARAKAAKVSHWTDIDACRAWEERVAADAAQARLNAAATVLSRALLVMVKAPAIRAFLEEHDPQALAQALDALATAGVM